MIFEGAISAKAILETNKRDIEYLMVDKTKDDRNTRYIINLAKSKNVEIRYVERQQIDDLASGKTHGGILLMASNRKNDSMYNVNITKNSTIFLLEGIEDPFNLGYAIRSFYAFGVDALIIKNQHLINSENIIVKSSAGASEKMPIIVVDDFAECINYFKNKNYKLVAMQRSENSSAYDQFNFDSKTLIAIGGEKRGLSKEVLNLVDKNVYIPYLNDFKNALNMTSAAITVASETARQKRNGN